MADQLQFNRRHLAEALRRIRLRKALSLRQLAKACGVSPSHILKIESGEYDFQVETLCRILMAMGIPSGMVLEEAVWSPPTFYTAPIEREGKLSELSAGAKEKYAKEALHLCCVSCAILAKLCVSSNVLWALSRVEFPPGGASDQLIPRFANAADDIQQRGFSDRASLLHDLAATPVDCLRRTLTYDADLLTAYLRHLDEHPKSRLNLAVNWLDAYV